VRDALTEIEKNDRIFEAVSAYVDEYGVSGNRFDELILNCLVLAAHDYVDLISRLSQADVGPLFSQAGDGDDSTGYSLVLTDLEVANHGRVACFNLNGHFVAVGFRFDCAQGQQFFVPGGRRMTPEFQALCMRGLTRTFGVWATDFDAPQDDQARERLLDVARSCVMSRELLMVVEPGRPLDMASNLTHWAVSETTVMAEPGRDARMTLIPDLMMALAHLAHRHELKDADLPFRYIQSSLEARSRLYDTILECDGRFPGEYFQFALCGLAVTVICTRTEEIIRAYSRVLHFGLSTPLDDVSQTDPLILEFYLNEHSPKGIMVLRSLEWDVSFTRTSETGLVLDLVCLHSPAAGGDAFPIMKFDIVFEVSEDENGCLTGKPRQDKPPTHALFLLNRFANDVLGRLN